MTTTSGAIGTEPIEQPDFTVELVRHITPVQAGLKQLLEEWGAPATASDLDRLSGAGATLCWQVFRLVNAENVLAEARNVPSPTYLRRLLAAAALAGVSDETIRAVEDASREFKDFSKRAATDRAAFESMVNSVGSEQNSEQILMSQRRAAYRAACHIMGIQTDLQLIATAIRKSASGDGTDMFGFSVQQGIRRLRPNSSVTLFGYGRNASGPQAKPASVRPIDPAAAAAYGMPLLPQFSTDPLPEVERVSLPSGWELYNTIGRDIGPRTDLNCAFGHIAQESPFMVDTDGRRLYYLSYSHIRKPAAMLVVDLLIHRESFPGVRPSFMAHQYTEGENTQEGARRSLQYPVEERPTFIGRGNIVSLDEMPRYGEMLRLGANATGWDLREFDVFRLRMPYPIMYSVMRMFFYVD